MGHFDKSKGDIDAQHWAVFLEFEDGFTTILPLSLDILGRRSRPWSAATWTFRCGSQPLQEVFVDFPMLVVCDAHLLHSVPFSRPKPGYKDTANTWCFVDDLDTYAPRTLAPAWLMLPHIKPGMDFASPV
jgi:hypothetical protein